MGSPSLDFEKLFKSHYTLLCNVTFRIIKDEQAAEDIVQEVFLKLWQRKDRLEDVVNFKAYLVRAVTNASIDHLKNNRSVMALTRVNDEDRKADNAEQAIIQKELEARIERALQLLPPKCRAIFVLSRHEGMKYKEIAEHLQISVKTVENQMGIALEKMRNELKPYLTREFISQPLVKAAATSVILLLILLF
ncbi:MAG: hypothetical protein K0S12_700 [Bacteroidetes bacterium]|nr:hypothetical protein [Bacteroidota bacterium]